jgi:hypothetical protein
MLGSDGVFDPPLCVTGVRRWALYLSHWQSAGMMRLVDDDKIRERHGHGARPDRARVQRLDRGDLRHSQRPQFLFVTGLDDAMSHAGGGELVGSLLDDLAAMGTSDFLMKTIANERVACSANRGHPRTSL